MEEHLASPQFLLDAAMAKAMGIPMIVVAGDETREIKTTVDTDCITMAEATDILTLAATDTREIKTIEVNGITMAKVMGMPMLVAVDKTTDDNKKKFDDCSDSKSSSSNTVDCDKKK
jgi:D-aminopeptidase